MGRDLFQKGKDLGLSDLEAEFLVVIGGFLNENKVRFQDEAIAQVAESHPKLEQDELEKAYRRAYKEWVEAYYD